MKDMTVLSADLYCKAQEQLNGDDMVALMTQGFALRSLSEKLLAHAGGLDAGALKKQLVDTLCANHPESSRDSVRRKVSNWLNGAHTGIAKADAIELAFALGLDLEEADALVASIAEEGLHWRDPGEIPFIFGLSHSMTYLECLDLRNRIFSEMTFDDDAEPPSGERAFTNIVRRQLMEIGSVDELMEYMSESRHSLGRRHNTAYLRFIQMLDTLTADDPLAADDDSRTHLSMRGVLDTYLFNGEVSRFRGQKARGGDKKGGDALLRRAILSGWPDETTISRMRSREIDVSRKVMILLELATCDTYSFDNELALELDDDGIELSDGELFELFRKSMDDFLISCGYCCLDPRAPFDWITLHCMFPAQVADAEIWEPNSAMREFLERYGSGNEIQDAEN